MLTFLFLLSLLLPEAQQHDAHAPGAEKPAALMTGLGRLHHPIATRSPEAQRFFDQGLTLIYGFNHDEAVRAFTRAAELDPASPMPHWGIALALGPNINLDVDPDREKAAYEEAQRARVLAASAPPNERAYIDAIVTRYSDDPKADLQALAGAVQGRDARSGDGLPGRPGRGDAVRREPDGPASLAALVGGRRTGEGTEAMVAALESVLRRDAMHIGANHYYIHAVEASRTPGRALASATRLETLVPAAGHLVHMPAHIYMRTGNYQGAVASNAKAAEVDRAYIKARGAGGVYPSMYYNHNLDFLASAAMMAGQFKQAKEAAGMVVANATPMIAEMPMLEAFGAKTLYVSLRFARWDEVMRLPQPDPKHALLAALWHFGRGIAQAARGNAADAERERSAYTEARTAIAPDAEVGYNKATDILAIADAALDGWLARAKRDDEGAVTAWKRAVAAEDATHYDEPADWFYPTRESLGAALLRAGRVDEAAQTFRDDLALNPGNGRSLYGLWQTLVTKKDRGAAAAEKLFREAWKHADVALRIADF